MEMKYKKEWLLSRDGSVDPYLHTSFALQRTDNVHSCRTDVYISPFPIGMPPQWPHASLNVPDRIGAFWNVRRLYPLRLSPVPRRSFCQPRWRLAYFQFHFLRSLAVVTEESVPSLLAFFGSLLGRGAGPWSLDAKRKKWLPQRLVL